jgi:putative ABC transport system permease protein
MGAAPIQIIKTLSKEFINLVLISLIISIPASWFIVRELLQMFAYRINIDVMVFIAISAGAIIIAFTTVSFQAFKATSINPAAAIKIE